MFANPSNEEIRTLFDKSQNIAVVGLSDKPYRTSHAIARTMQNYGFKIFPVNPNLDKPVLGEMPYASLKDIEEHIDIVDVFRRSELVPPVAKEAVEVGAGAIWLQLGVVNEGAAEYASENGLMVVMDRCIKVDYAALARG